jgi:heme-degrading monooxygenase HmoA
MTTIIINAITVPEGGGDELARRFGARAGAVDGQEGFEGFELLRPMDEGRNQWLVMTRWKDRASFEAWFNSQAFQHGHAKAEGAPHPVSVQSEVWHYEVEDLPAPGGHA